MSSVFPVVGTTLHDQSDNYGAGRSGGRSHKGLDIFAPKGAPVVAVRGGTVVKAGDPGGLSGIRVWIRDDQGYYHFYAHLDSFNVESGQRVESGQQIGTVGNTGREAVNTPDHLHYSVNREGATGEHGNINPYEFLRDNGAITSGTVQAEDSFTAAARRQQRSEAGLPEIGPDPNAEFLAGRRTQSETMASIMSFISDAASRKGGKVLDTKALFGDVFSDTEDDAADDGHDHGSEVA